MNYGNPTIRQQEPDSSSAVEGTRVTVAFESRITRRHLTIADLCEELEIARSTFYYWRQLGKAPRCIKLPNGEIRIRRTDLESWLSMCEEAIA